MKEKRAQEGRPEVIAIDGPAASGKSSVGQLLAERLGYLYYDTGALYRAVTWAALARGVNPEDREKVERLAEGLEIRLERPQVADGRQYTVWVDGQDATWQIRGAEVEAWVSLVSSYQGVRQALLAMQRRMAKHGGVVMVGRDIGTVVVPWADLKIYLEASPEERARRRQRELLERGREVSYNEVLEEMQRRDGLDSGRTLAPLRPAPDAVVINTEGLDVPEVVAEIERLLQ